MPKSFYNQDSNESYTRDAQDLTAEARVHLQLLMEKWYVKGYPTRQIEQLLHEAVTDVALHFRITPIEKRPQPMP